MSYQVLARKWRPRDFSELAGQEHVQRALINALNNDRLHHAFLFTGTRGVGKTTIARILAKSLNCETGVTATPCGKCSACTEINEGRFIDLIEVDAASKTKVEDTRELLENVQYVPTRGRYKVYLIDEVHMLSTHSFNALLKTLEEPPPHVKFLLATTDPQKLPVTILSRCLQFNLKRLPPDLIVAQLQKILKQEQISFEDTALMLIATAADGSMRDALSLLDQAIAYGAGALKEDEVRSMLGTIDTQHIYDLALSLANRDARQILSNIDQLAMYSADFDNALSEFLSLLHKIAIAQVAPLTVDDQIPENKDVLKLANTLTPEDTQLFYQIGLIGRRDLPYAPNAKLGFEMTILRMLAFTPDDITVESSSSTKAPNATQSTANASPASVTQQVSSSASSAKDEQLNAISKTLGAVTDKKKQRELKNEAAATIPRINTAATSPGKNLALPTDTNEWETLIDQLTVNGVALQLAKNCAFLNCTSSNMKLALSESHQHFLNDQRKAALQQAIQNITNSHVVLDIVVKSEQLPDTPAIREQQRQDNRQKSAETAIYTDENIKSIVEAFDAQVIPKSIEPTK